MARNSKKKKSEQKLMKRQQSDMKNQWTQELVLWKNR